MRHWPRRNQAWFRIIEDATYLANQLSKHAKTAQSSGVKGKVKAAQAAKKEVQEAKQYKDTKKKAATQDPKFKNIKPVQMDSKPKYMAKAAASAKTQAAHVAKTKGDLLKKCKQKANPKAIKNYKKRMKALKACDAKYQGI